MYTTIRMMKINEIQESFKKFLYNNIDYKDAYLIHFQTIQV